MAGQEMVRVSVQVTPETLEQINGWCDKAGFKRGYFMSLALTKGARDLAKQLHPEDFLTPDMWTGMAQALGVDAKELQDRLAELEAKRAA